MNNKITQRQEILAQRKILSEDFCQNASQYIIQSLITHPAYISAHTIGIYYPIHHEVNLLALFNIAEKEGKKIVLPKVVDSRLRGNDVEGRKNDAEGRGNDVKKCNNDAKQRGNNIKKQEKNLEFFQISASKLHTHLKSSRFGIPEPIETCPKVLLTNINCLIMPLVGFDKKGHRLGMGQGYYDRALANKKNRPYLMGVAYAFQECEAILTDPWDVKLDTIITEKNIFLR